MLTYNPAHHGHCSDTGLQQNVRRGYAHFTHLLDGFICQGCVALHDPGWGFWRNLPCRWSRTTSQPCCCAVAWSGHVFVIVHSATMQLAPRFAMASTVFPEQNLSACKSPHLFELPRCQRPTPRPWLPSVVVAKVIFSPMAFFRRQMTAFRYEDARFFTQ